MSQQSSALYQQWSMMDPFRPYLRAAIGSICTEVGFEAAETSSLETMTELTQSLITELGRSTRGFCELAGRVEPVAGDLVLALVEMGINVNGLYQAFRTQSPDTLRIKEPKQMVAPKQTAMLHSSEYHLSEGFPLHIPSHMPKMPDPHTYIRSPAIKKPITDYETVREKAANQKRDVERALTRFIAKTGKTHNLFNTTDTNLYPLISPQRRDNKVKLPAYLNALLCRDQVFEEDEIELLPKKPNSKEPCVNQEIGGGAKNAIGHKFETEKINNPFLLPAKMPKQVPPIQKAKSPKS